MKIISISLTDKASGSSETVCAEFEDQEMASFEDYLTNTERLLQSKIVRDGMQGGLRLKYDQSQGFSCEVQLPDEDSILALLHRLRRFILNDEFSSYNRVTGIVNRRFENSKVREMLKAQRRLYDGRDFQKAIVISSNGKTINSEEMLYNWLNSFEYHNDQTKKAELEKLHQLMPLDASRAVFLMMLTDKVKSIVAVANFISLLLGRVETAEANACEAWWFGENTWETHV